MVLPFDRILIISLKKAHIRRKKLDKHISELGGLVDKHGNKPVYITANEGYACNHSVDNTIKRKNLRRATSQSEIGCFASHRECWGYQITNDLESVLILEDDFRIQSRAITVFENWDKMPDWDYVNFGFTTNKASIQDTIKNAGHPEFRTLFQGSGMWLTHAYCINLQTAKYFLSKTEVQYGGIDWQLTGLQGQVKSYGFFQPDLIKQEPVSFSNPSFIKHTQ